MTPTEGTAICLLYSFLYVGVLYLRKNEAGDHRDHPNVVRFRLKAIALLCCFIYVANNWIYSHIIKEQPPKTTNQQLGLVFYPFSVLFRSIVMPLILIASLFLGPLYHELLRSRLRNEQYYSSERDTLLQFRALIMAPLSEEFVFRASILSILVHSEWSTTSLILMSPVFFGLSHVHHLKEYYLNNGRTMLALKRGIIITIVQFAYTTIFGCICSFVFLRTGSFISTVVLHIFCNWIGLPRFKEAFYPSPFSTVGITYFVGVFLFYYLLYPLTNPLLIDPSGYFLVPRYK